MTGGAVSTKASACPRRNGLMSERRPFAAISHSVRCRCHQPAHVQPTTGRRPYAPAALHARVDVSVAEVADPDVAADPGSGRLVDDAALDREHTVCAAGRRAWLGPVVANGHVDTRVW